MADRFTVDSHKVIYDMLSRLLAPVKVYRKPDSKATKKLPIIVYQLTSPGSVPNAGIIHGTRCTLVLNVLSEDFDELSQLADTAIKAVLSMPTTPSPYGKVSYATLESHIEPTGAQLPAEGLEAATLTFNLTVRK